MSRPSSPTSVLTSLQCRDFRVGNSGIGRRKTEADVEDGADRTRNETSWRCGLGRPFGYVGPMRPTRAPLLQELHSRSVLVGMLTQHFGWST